MVRSLATLVTRGEDVCGADMSVIVRVRSGEEERRAVVRDAPIKPPAPVMRIDGILNWGDKWKSKVRGSYTLERT